MHSSGYANASSIYICVFFHDSRDHWLEPFSTMLVLDRREKELSCALQGFQHTCQELPVGDVLCQYSEQKAWIAERKTASDLAACIKNGRLAEQTARLHAAGYQQIFWFVEGDLEDQALPYTSLLGACTNMALRRQSHLLRTVSVKETAAFIIHLVDKCRSLPGVPSGIVPPSPITKRKRDADKTMVFLRQLCCIPTISECIAERLVEKFGTLTNLQKALLDLDTFPEVRLSGTMCLGRTRLERLRHHLCHDD